MEVKLGKGLQAVFFLALRSPVWLKLQVASAVLAELGSSTVLLKRKVEKLFSATELFSAGFSSK